MVQKNGDKLRPLARTVIVVHQQEIGIEHTHSTVWVFFSKVARAPQPFAYEPAGCMALHLAGNCRYGSHCNSVADEATAWRRR